MFKRSNKSQSPMLYSILEILESGNQMGVTLPMEDRKKLKKRFKNEPCIFNYAYVSIALLERLIKSLNLQTFTLPSGRVYGVYTKNKNGNLTIFLPIPM